MNRAADATELQGLLRRAALLRALAQSFAYPQAFSQREVGASLRRAKHNGRRASDAALRRSVREAQRAWSQTPAQTLRAAYARLFLGAGSYPPRETAYGDGRRVSGRPVELSDINGFYAAFGVRPSNVQPDLPDHLCAELEFCSLLLVKLAYAKARPAPWRASVTSRALRAFLQDHLGRWPATFAEELRRAPDSAPYAKLADAVAQVIQREARAAGARPRPATGKVRDDQMQSDEMICPMSPGATRASNPDAAA